MLRKKIVEIIEDEAPQKSLEKILQAEIQITEKISKAKEKAEKRMDAARDKVASFKEQIIEKARDDREKILAEGISNAQAGAEKQIEAAKIESENFEKSGMQYIGEAIQLVEKIILGDLKCEEE